MAMIAVAFCGTHLVRHRRFDSQGDQQPLNGYAEKLVYEREGLEGVQGGEGEK